MKMKQFLLLVLMVLFLAACGEMEETSSEEETSDEISVEEDIEETEELINNGCKNGEEYVEEENICVLPIECDDIDSCIAWGNELIASLEDTYGSLTEEGSEATDDDNMTVLFSYNVDNEADTIIPEDDVADEDFEWHYQLWSGFSWLIPEQCRQNINRFFVFDSGSYLAYIEYNDDYGEYWTLGMNNENIELASETLVTYIHEYAHYLSLNDQQVDYTVYEEDCYGLYLDDTGCFYEDSYFYDFYYQFWADGGYEDFEDNYVSEYAMEHSEEDFAESFTHFVLTQTPEGNTVAEEKVLYFYEFEEFIELRTEILSRVATWLDRNVEL